MCPRAFQSALRLVFGKFAISSLRRSIAVIAVRARSANWSSADNSSSMISDGGFHPSPCFATIALTYAAAISPFVLVSGGRETVLVEPARNFGGHLPTYF